MKNLILNYLIVFMVLVSCDSPPQTNAVSNTNTSTNISTGSIQPFTLDYNECYLIMIDNPKRTRVKSGNGRFSFYHNGESIITQKDIEGEYVWEAVSAVSSHMSDVNGLFHVQPVRGLHSPDEIVAISWFFDGTVRLSYEEFILEFIP